MDIFIACGQRFHVIFQQHLMLFIYNISTNLNIYIFLNCNRNDFVNDLNFLTSPLTSPMKSKSSSLSHSLTSPTQFNGSNTPNTLSMFSPKSLPTPSYTSGMLPSLINQNLYIVFSIHMTSFRKH